MTGVGRSLLAYVLRDDADFDDIWGHGEEAGLVAAAFVVATRRRFSSSALPHDVSAFVTARRTCDSRIDPLAAEAAVRVALGQVEVLQGFPRSLVAEGSLSLLRPLAREVCAEDGFVDWIREAEVYLSEMVRSGLLNQFLEQE